MRNWRTGQLCSCDDKNCTPETCMNLPQDKTCENCIFEKFCEQFHGRTKNSTACDWFPRRFKESKGANYVIEYSTDT